MHGYLNANPKPSMEHHEMVSPYEVLKVFVGAGSARKQYDFQDWLEACDKGGYLVNDLRVEVRDTYAGQDRVFECWAKVWTLWDADLGVHVPMRLGLGAYGDTTAWVRRYAA